MKTALIIFWSKTGNTEKVANAIKQGLEEAEFNVAVKKPEEAAEIDYFDYDLVCVGCPSYSWHPPEPITNFLKKKFARIPRKWYSQAFSPKSSGQERHCLCNLLGTTYRNQRGNSSWQGYSTIL